MPFPLDEQYIVKTEDKLGLKFPDTFRNKMITENGGEVKTPTDSWELHPFFDTSDRRRLRRTSNDIIRETASAKEWVGFPENAIAIGQNDFGDRLIFLPSESDSTILDKAVYWWDHETGNIQKIANDFSGLID